MSDCQTASYTDFESKEIYMLDDSSRNIGLPPSEVNGTAERWSAKVMDEFSLNNKNVTEDSGRKVSQNAPLHCQSGWEKDSESLSSIISDKDNEQRNVEQECLMTVEEFTHNINGSSDSIFSRFVQTDKNLSTDEHLVDCNLPELEVCYKEMDYYEVKDICIIEAKHEDKILIKSVDNDKSGHSVPQNRNDNNHSNTNEVGINTGVLMSEIRDAQLQYVACEVNWGTTDKVVTVINSLEETSLMDSKLPILELDSKSSMESLLSPLDGEVKGVKQQSHEILDREEVSAEDGCPGSLLDNIKVESGGNSSNLDSPVQVVAGITDGIIIEDDKEDSFDSRNVHNPNAKSVEEARNVHENFLKPMDGNSSVTPLAYDKEDSNEMVPEQGNKDRDDTATDGGKFHSPINKNHPDNQQLVEPNDLQLEHRNYDSASVMSQLQDDKGETSFSAASLTAYSGPSTASGNISHRSDGSATSAGSFAFPILQSEWSSSPVRMVKANRRQLWKHKCWLSIPGCFKF